MTVNPRGIQVLWLVLVVGCVACKDAGPTQLPPAADAATAEIAAGSADSAATSDTGPDDVAATDVSGPCAQACAGFAGCKVLSQAACLAACVDADPCGQICVTQAPGCEAAADCLRVATPSSSFAPGPYASSLRSLAADFTLPLDAGDWSLQAAWNGRDSHVFLFTADGFKYATDLWKTSVKAWLQASPTNVHYFFLHYGDAKGKTPALAQVDKMRAAVGSALEKMDPFAQCQWWPRLHFVEPPIQSLPGALLDAAKGGVAHVAIDREQRWRAVGLLQPVGGTVDLRFLNFEVRHWNFEAERAATLAGQDAKLITVHKAADGAGFDLTLDLPPATELAAYDTLHLDLGGWCKDHQDKNCGEWDYVATASLCEIPNETNNPDAATACQPQVPEIAAAPEKSGTCKGGSTSCKVNGDCGARGVCEGYKAAVQGQTGVAAATKACTCTGVDGNPSARNKTCKPDGKGFGACECPCPLEIGRWITPYRREGRWVSDATPFLAYLGRGGKQRIALDAANLPMVDFTLRFSKQNKGLRPFHTVDLFTGGSFHQTYSDKYKPLQIAIPPGTKKVELFALITGHGWGAEKENCAEFCNHSHHFTINGKEYVRAHPVAGQTMGCADQVAVGTVPNQYGTWHLGRAGWCPGMDVKPFQVDVTGSVKVGSEAVVSYKGLFKGAPYKPEPSANNPGGFGADIRMLSWLVFYQ